MTKRSVASHFTLVGFLVVVLTLGTHMVHAQSSSYIDELRDQISGHSEEIGAIEAEIKQYEEELDGVLEEKESLQNAVRTLDISYNKLNADVKITGNRISATTFQIEKLALEIDGKTGEIDAHKDVLAASIRAMDEAESQTLAEQLLSYDKLSDLWTDVESLTRLQYEVQQNLQELRGLRVELEDTKALREGRRRELVNFNYELTEQKKVVTNNRSEKNTLLSYTKNEESNYKSLLEEKRAAQKEFESLLADLESQLKIAIDPNSIPAAQHGLLAWPLDSIRISQYFGNTEFSQNEGRAIYNGKGHGAIDLAIAQGNPVRAARDGVITITGNTDEIKGCYSYGKWILVEHDVGLSTFYTHLSQRSVKPGQQVVKGQIIGYSGNTGYSTGPHLHFGVFATQGIRLVKFSDVKKVTNCGAATVPIVSNNAKFDPLIYLPQLES